MIVFRGMPQEKSLPVLYSFRRCPYAMRARLAIYHCGQRLELREILLRDKPKAMIKHSPKATVPVLILPDDTVIEESLEIMLWALGNKDQENLLLTGDKMKQALQLIEENDTVFKKNLDMYKYAQRFPENPREFYRSNGETFLQKLESQLNVLPYLSGNTVSITDLALFPFVRQFAHVDQEWFFQADYPKLHGWLNTCLNSTAFRAIMEKYPPWQPGAEPIYFP